MKSLASSWKPAAQNLKKIQQNQALKLPTSVPGSLLNQTLEDVPSIEKGKKNDGRLPIF